jgi:hypothetical protein
MQRFALFWRSARIDVVCGRSVSAITHLPEIEMEEPHYQSSRTARLLAFLAITLLVSALWPDERNATPAPAPSATATPR